MPVARSVWARRPRLVEHEVEIDGLCGEHDGVRIVHLTDIHCGRRTPAAHVRAAVELANSAHADVIAMTGDYVCWSRREVPIMKEQLSGLRARKVLVTLGNHDYFASGEDIAAAMVDNGYTVLRNEHASVELGAASLHVVGIDDPVTQRHDVDRAFSAVPSEGTRVVLCHCPEQVDDVARYRAHLMLSGHTHGGQVNVKGITDRIFKKAGRRFYEAGFYNVNDTLMYLSPGVGFSGLGVRAGRGTHAEVSVFTLRASRS